MGKEKTEFTVHNDIISKRSVFLREIISDKVRLLNEDAIVLSYITTEDFEAYLWGVYAGEVSVMTREEMERDAGKTEHLHRLMQLCVVARKLRDIRLSNLIVDEVERHFRQAGSSLPTVETIELIYTGLGSRSKMCELVLDKCSNPKHEKCNRHGPGTGEQDGSQCAYEAWLIKEWDKLPEKFLKSVMRLNMRQSCDKSTSAEVNHPCHYHEHNEEVPLCALRLMPHPECMACGPLFR